MQDEVALLFREVADLAPAARSRYFEEHRVPPELRDEVESLLQFDIPDGEITDAIAAAAEGVLDTPGAEQGLRCGPSDYESQAGDRRHAATIAQQ